MTLYPMVGEGGVSQVMRKRLYHSSDTFRFLGAMRGTEGKTEGVQMIEKECFQCYTLYATRNPKLIKHVHVRADRVMAGPSPSA